LIGVGHFADADAVEDDPDHAAKGHVRLLSPLDRSDRDNRRPFILAALGVFEYGAPAKQGRHPCYSKDSMAKVTSKYQVTVPRTIAIKYNIHPGDEIDWVAAGEVIRVIPPAKQPEPEDRASRLRLFDQATERLRQRSPAPKGKPPRDRGWKREDLYTRGRPR
jgi:bifunctional DNA-binding transcriptional regulator/antitoxin component of YhaV-PrlF toxin-antitoxin module